MAGSIQSVASTEENAMWSQVEQALNQSATNVMTGIARLLPGTIALLVSIVVAIVLGWILAAVLRRALTGIEFDRLMVSWGWSDVAGWTGATSPTILVARTAFWLVVLFGIVVGLAAFDPTITSQLAFGLFGSAMNLLTAIVILIAGNVLARFLARSVLISLVNMNIQQARLLSLGVKWLVIITAAAMAMDHVNIGGHIVDLAFGILFGGIVLALALAIGLRSKDLAEWSLSRPSDETKADGGQPVDHL
jgi:hypothetical protein